MSDTKLIAYHGDPELKAQTIAQMKQHRIADTIIKGHYWQGGKGSAVGCLTHGLDGGHDQYPELFGIPEWLAHLEDRVFSNLPNDQAKLWQERFLSAIQPGADFDGLKDRLAILRLRECLRISSVWDHEYRQQVVDAIEQTIEAIESGTEDELLRANYAARLAANDTTLAFSAYSGGLVLDTPASSANSAANSAALSAWRPAGYLAAEYSGAPALAANAAARSFANAAALLLVKPIAWAKDPGAADLAAKRAKSDGNFYAWSEEADRIIAELEKLGRRGDE